MGKEKIYALAQPTTEGIGGVLDAVKGKPLWVNIREEPLIMINSVPYVLRDDSYALRRNLATFQAIPASRLELLEDRLRSDVCVCRTLKRLTRTQAVRAQGVRWPHPRAQRARRRRRRASLGDSSTRGRGYATIRDAVSTAATRLQLRPCSFDRRARA